MFPGAATPASPQSALWLRRILLALAVLLFCLHFVHLDADFPNHSPWRDWSKYTDEGWYGDAAIRHYTSGHWFFPGDFNPAVALPVWPAIELVVFRLTGVSVIVARATTLVIFGLMLLALFWLIERHTRPRTTTSGPPLAAALTVLLLTASPFFFVFERMAILEPLLIALMVFALCAASLLRLPTRTNNLAANAFALLPTLALALLIPAMVLTKTTAVCLIPAVLWMIWARAGYRLRRFLALAVPPFAGAVALWLAYFLLFVRPHYLADYRYLFSANAYTGIELEPFSRVILNTLADGNFMGAVLYGLFFIALGLMLLWRPRLLTNPLVPVLLLWIAGYLVFLAYHNNLQPRYYLVVALPVTVFVALALDTFRDGPSTLRGRVRLLARITTVAVTAAILVPDLLTQADYLLHPTYTLLSAAQGVAKVIRATPDHPQLLLSISGSDITLITGVPSICDDFGTLDLNARVAQYHPGWYAAWNGIEDDKANALTPLYRIIRVAQFSAMDDPDRNQLILYRLDLAPTESETPRRHRRTPKPLQTRLGQQPSTTQLEH